MRIEPHKVLNKVFFNTKIIRAEMDNFKTQMITLLDAINEKETEEFHKNLVISFLKKTFYDPNYFVNTKGRNDLVIHNGKDAKTTVGVIIEAKSPINKAEMISIDDLNGKALQELVLYYLRERITHKNTDLKQLVVTNIYEWFIFDAHIFNKLFADDKKFVAKFIDFEEKRASGKTTDFFYNDIAKPFIETIKTELQYTYFDIRAYEKPLRNEDKKDDKLLVSLYKLISPEHLMKLPFANDSNTLDRGFYTELLHIIGLTEIKDGGKKIITRLDAKNRHSGSLLENTITQLDSIDVISHLKNPKNYGETQDEKLFNVALELCITWVNRILFLKLLEAQLKVYHKGDENYLFLNSKIIKDYDELNRLFFQVLARKPELRNQDVTKLFANVPYLNSSLFEPTELEREAFMISTLEDNKSLNLLSTTVITDNIGKKMTGNLNSLNYFLSFLDAYNFASDGDNVILEDNKTLINAAVLGLIFEKINGYKDGSFFTPSFITMYMCKETIRRAVVQKFSHLTPTGGKIETYEDVKAYCHHFYKIEDKIEYNKLINSLKICDPAVGSGHFLVSALNEIIAIKNDLGILMDKDHYALKIDVEIVNDELIIIDENGNKFQYDPNKRDSQRLQKTLFHEKQTIIENCLFGVDINPNSVKICQLRLWIELLKNAYYKEFPADSPSGKPRVGLETLPNIDINIKCGNSLISRFGLDADLKKALSDSKWTIDTYKLAVYKYQNAKSKEQKREMIALIEEVKANFKTEISTNDPKKLKLEKAKGELFNKTNQTGMFELGKKEAAIWNKQINLLSSEILVLETEIEDIKSSRIYDRAFEWRFEFPQVLNDDGDFIGFDVVIGNPPYIVYEGNFKNDIQGFSLFKIYDKCKGGKLNAFELFLAKTDELLKKEGLTCQIFQNSFLGDNSAKGVRESYIKNNQIITIDSFPERDDPNKRVFENAKMSVCILLSKKQFQTNYNFNLNIYEKNDLNIFDTVRYSKEEIINFDPINFVFPTILQNEKAIFSKYTSFIEKISDYYECIEGELNMTFHKKYMINDASKPKIIKGAQVQRYFISDKPSQGLVEYVDEINYLKDFSKSKKSEHNKSKRIVLQGITGANDKIRIVSTLLDENKFCANSCNYIISKSNENLFYLLGILNSKFINWVFKKSSTNSNVNCYEINNILLPLHIKSTQQPLIEIVEKILSLKQANPQADTLALEQEIDVLVYDLYGLTAEEIKIVEGN